jgi:hypothetical protein
VKISKKKSGNFSKVCKKSSLISNLRFFAVTLLEIRPRHFEFVGKVASRVFLEIFEDGVPPLWAGLVVIGEEGVIAPKEASCDVIGDDHVNGVVGVREEEEEGSQEGVD